MKRVPAFLIKSSPFSESWSPVLARENPGDRDAIQALVCLPHSTYHPAKSGGSLFLLQWKRLDTLQPTTFTQFRLNANRFALTSSAPLKRSSPSKRNRRDLPITMLHTRRPSEASIVPSTRPSIALDEDDGAGPSSRGLTLTIPTNVASPSLEDDSTASPIEEVSAMARTTRFMSAQTTIDDLDEPENSVSEGSELSRLRRENSLLRSQLSSMTLSSRARSQARSQTLWESEETRPLTTRHSRSSSVPAPVSRRVSVVQAVTAPVHPSQVLLFRHPSTVSVNPHAERIAEFFQLHGLEEFDDEYGEVIPSYEEAVGTGASRYSHVISGQDW